MILGTVRGQTLRLSYPTVVADTIDYLEAAFSFEGTEWEGLSKWAHFKMGDRVFSVVLTEDTIRREDHLNLSAGEWEVYVHGDAIVSGETVRRITTRSCKMQVAESGVLDGEPLPISSPSVGEQILAKAEQALSATGEFRVEVNRLYSDIGTALDEIIAYQDGLISNSEVEMTLDEIIKEQNSLIGG